MNPDKQKELDAAVLKAVEATNYCTKHRQYHGQKLKSCTPQERVVVELTAPIDPPESKDWIDEVLSKVWKAGQSEDWDLKKVVEAKQAITHRIEEEVRKARESQLQGQLHEVSMAVAIYEANPTEIYKHLTDRKNLLWGGLKKHQATDSLKSDRVRANTKVKSKLAQGGNK